MLMEIAEDRSAGVRSEQAKGTHLADVVTVAIALHGVAEFFFNLAAMLGIAHFNEIDDDLPADVAQAKLAGDGPSPLPCSYGRP